MKHRQVGVSLVERRVDGLELAIESVQFDWETAQSYNDVGEENVELGLIPQKRVHAVLEELEKTALYRVDQRVRHLFLERHYVALLYLLQELLFVPHFDAGSERTHGHTPVKLFLPLVAFLRAYTQAICSVAWQLASTLCILV